MKFVDRDDDYKSFKCAALFSSRPRACAHGSLSCRSSPLRRSPNAPTAAMQEEIRAKLAERKQSIRAR
jgi:hypothetical protein